MIYLVDASVYVFRAYFSIPDDMFDSEGNSVNALYGFGRFVGDFLENVKPSHICIAFDESLTSSFRNEIYADYKANRDPTPPDLKQQFARCRELVEGLGVMVCSSNRYEADDLIGALAVSMRRVGHHATVVSRDKDLTQVLRSGDIYWDYSGNKRLGYEDVRGEFGVWPEQIADYLALAGDAVDNIPGVRGVGKKTAAALLNHFDSLDDIYRRLDEVPEVKVRGAAKLGAKLEAHKAEALMSRRLTELAWDSKTDATEDDLRRARPNLEALSSLYDSVGFGPALRRQAERIAASFEV